MRLEAFTCGKSFDRPQDNEDAFVALPGLGYAVIDGVTDRSQRNYGTMRAGRFAATTVARRLAAFLASADARSGGGEARVSRLLDELAGALREGYAEHGRLDEAQSSPALRAGCTLALAMHDGDDLRLVAIGDSGIRVTGPDLGLVAHDGAKPLDHVTSTMRREAWLVLEAAGASPEMRLAASDSVARHGLASPPPALDPATAATLRERVTALCLGELPSVPAAEIARLVERGIDAQRGFANRDDLSLGYGVLDGFGIPARHVFSRTIPLAQVRRIELFTDGYFDPPEAFGVAAWEESFLAVERHDPHKVVRWPSTKGSTPGSWTDDRTYLGVEL